MIFHIILIIQFFFTITTGLYFYRLLKSQGSSRKAVERDSRKQIVKLDRLRSVSLNIPLTEKTRPVSIDDIVGQEEGIKALRSVLCGPFPQHVIIYGPPGVGKTAAARVILEEAKKMPCSPFNENSPFVEVDAGTMRFDERGIADPLIGSVHDPIYQGAGAYGTFGIPQPKPGAVSKAHGGILFIDEIGELHPMQLNKLLKILEDRRVFFESAYYNRELSCIPPHIHYIFENGLPSDFRLVGATTRAPWSVPEAIRSRCVEIFFKELHAKDIIIIAERACLRLGFTMESGASHLISQYAANGRDAVKILQIAGSAAALDGRKIITIADIEWVINFGNYSPRIQRKLDAGKYIGRVNGLCVTGHKGASVLPIEITCNKNKGLADSYGNVKNGSIKITGINEFEEIKIGQQVMKRKSMIRSSVENALTMLQNIFHIDVSNIDLHINFPGAALVDGPSAGVAIACGIYSVIYSLPVPGDIAFTGEISIHGDVLPVGDVPGKIDAAIKAGASKVIIPLDNYQVSFSKYGNKVIPAANFSQVFKEAFGSNLFRDRSEAING